MSPPAVRRWGLSVRFPRVSGDEPWNQLADAIPGAFSPRERG